MSAPTAVSGHGTCLACYGHGIIVQAVDVVAGSACARHLRDPGWIPERPGTAAAATRARRRAEWERAEEKRRQREEAEERQRLHEQIRAAGGRAPERARVQHCRKRRAWDALTELGREICESKALRPTGWAVPSEVFKRLGELGDVGLVQVRDIRTALAAFEDAVAAGARPRADRYWNMRAVLFALVWLQDSYQGNLIQATEEHLAVIATEFKEGWAARDFRVDGFGGPADLANTGMTQRTVSTVLDILKELRLATCLLKGCSAAALGAEHGRASIWALTVAAEPDEAPDDAGLTPLSTDEPSGYPQELVAAARTETSTALPSCANPLPGPNFLPPLGFQHGYRSAQTLPESGSLFHVKLDPQLDAKRSAFGAQRHNEARSTSEESSASLWWEEGAGYLDEPVSPEECMPELDEDAPSKDDITAAEPKGRHKKRARFADDRLWDKRNPRAKRARQEATSRTLSLAGLSGRIPNWNAEQIFRPFYDAGWTPQGLLHAIARGPGAEGKRHPILGPGDDVQSIPRLLRWRLSLWKDAGGVPLAPPFPAVAPYARANRLPSPAKVRAREVAAARARAEAEAADRRGTVDPAHRARCREEIRAALKRRSRR